MSHHSAEVVWQRDDLPFLDQRYSRAHLWRFDGGTEVAASASPHFVPLPYSDASTVDPEEAFVASLASCHMLWFLSLAAERGFRVDHYADHAIGEMGRNDTGRLAVTAVTLRPAAVFSGERLPSHDDIGALHHAAHDACFIANSVRTEVRCEPRF